MSYPYPKIHVGMSFPNTFSTFTLSTSSAIPIALNLCTLFTYILFNILFILATKILSFLISKGLISCPHVRQIIFFAILLGILITCLFFKDNGCKKIKLAFSPYLFNIFFSSTRQTFLYSFKFSYTLLNGVIK